MLNIPKTLKIGGHIWEIKYPYIFQERFDRFAQCDDGKKIIYLSDLEANGGKRPDSAVTVSFIHEILHAAAFLTGHEDMFEGNQGESRIEGLSEAIYQIIADNPQLKDVFKS